MPMQSRSKLAKAERKFQANFYKGLTLNPSKLDNVQASHIWDRLRWWGQTELSYEQWCKSIRFKRPVYLRGHYSDYAHRSGKVRVLRRDKPVNPNYRYGLTIHDYHGVYVAWDKLYVYTKALIEYQMPNAADLLKELIECRIGYEGEDLCYLTTFIFLNKLMQAKLTAEQQLSILEEYNKYANSYRHDEQLPLTTMATCNYFFNKIEEIQNGKDTTVEGALSKLRESTPADFADLSSKQGLVRGSIRPRQLGKSQI